MKLTLGQAAKTAKKAKGTLSKALNRGELSAQKDDNGRWCIDPSELSRWMNGKPFPSVHKNRSETPSVNGLETGGNGSLEQLRRDIEVKMLREQIETLNAERERERNQLLDQVRDLRTRLDGAETERIRLNAVLTDQREKQANLPKPSLWARLVG